MNQFDARELTYFVTVAQSLHFGQAADQLGITQPPLSRAIARLERRVGASLLTRTTRSVELTAAGQVFLDQALAILSMMDAAVRKTRSAAEPQSVTIAVRPGSGPGILPGLLDAVHGSGKGVQVKVHFTYDEITAVQEGIADAAMTCRSTVVPGAELVELAQEHPVVLLPAAHPLAARPSVTLQQVQQLPGYQADLPNEALDVIVDRVALGELIVVIGESANDRLGAAVRSVPVEGFPVTQLVLAWLPRSRSIMGPLIDAAHAVGAEVASTRPVVLTLADDPAGAAPLASAAVTGSRGVPAA